MSRPLPPHASEGRSRGDEKVVARVGISPCAQVPAALPAAPAQPRNRLRSVEVHTPDLDVTPRLLYFYSSPSGRGALGAVATARIDYSCRRYTAIPVTRKTRTRTDSDTASGTTRRYRRGYRVGGPASELGLCVALKCVALWPFCGRSVAVPACAADRQGLTACAPWSVCADKGVTVH